MSKAVKYTIFLILLLLIILLIIANLFLPQIYMYFAPKPEQTGELSASPVLVSEDDNLYKVDIKFKSGDDVDVSKPISAVAFSLSYPSDPSLAISVVDESGVLTNKVTLGPIISSEQWVVPINSIKQTQNGVEIEFAAINTTPTGFTSSNFVTLGSVFFKSDQPLDKDVFVLTFNTDESAILSKIKPAQDILNTNAKLFYSVE